MLPTTYGSVDLAKASVEWDPRATEPAFTHLLSRTERHPKDGAAIARIRFAHGNATANVRVPEQPKVDLVFERDTWAGLSLFSVGDCMATAGRCIRELATLFGEETWPVHHDPQSHYEW